MKLYLPILAMLLSTAAVAQQTAPSTASILKEAQAVAAKEKKNVFIIFHASWCGWCHQMDTAMASAACKPLFDKSYVIRHITVMENDKHKADENPGGVELMTEYGAGKSGIPYWIIFDKNGKALADSQIRPDGADIHTAGTNIGCPASKEEVAQFTKILHKTSKLTDNEINVIAARFSKIAEAMKH